MPFDANGKYINDSLSMFGDTGVSNTSFGNPTASGIGSGVNFFDTGTNANSLGDLGIQNPNQSFAGLDSTATQPPTSGGIGDFFSSGTLNNVGTAAQGVSALANTYFGYQNMKTAKDQLAENTRQFNVNYAEQKANQDQYYTDRTAARAAAFA